MKKLIALLKSRHNRRGMTLVEVVASIGIVGTAVLFFGICATTSTKMVMRGNTLNTESSKAQAELEKAIAAGSGDSESITMSVDGGAAQSVDVTAIRYRLPGDYDTMYLEYYKAR